MFFRLYKTRLKCLSKNYRILFWTFLLPFLLSLLSYLGFNRLFAGDTQKDIPVAVVAEEGSKAEVLTRVLKTIKTEENKELFQVTACTLDRARDLLDQGSVDGYIVYDDGEGPILYIRENGKKQTLLKTWLDRYKQWESISAADGAKKDETAFLTWLDQENQTQSFIKEGRFEKESENYLPFYCCIAFSCILGAYWGFYEIIHIQADQSLLGVRLGIAPVRKRRLLACNMLAAFTIHFFSILFLTIILRFALHVQFGGKPWMLLIICLFGSLCSINSGAMLSAVIQANVKVREAALSLFLISEVVLSGMVAADMKNIIEIKASALALLNPFSLVAGAFYGLTYYSGYGKSFLDLFMLFILAVVFGIVTLWNIRRKEYAGI